MEIIWLVHHERPHSGPYTERSTHYPREHLHSLNQKDLKNQAVYLRADSV